MDHSIIHIKMEVKYVIHEFWVQKSMAFVIFFKKINDVMHHVNIQVKIFKPSPF